MDYDRFLRNHHQNGIGPYTAGVYLLQEGHPPDHVRAAISRFHGRGLRHSPHIYAHRIASAGLLIASLIMLARMTF